MPDLSVNRTLVKSPPELWNEVSEAESLAQHLGEFGEIAIQRLDPEHTVAWEGEHARGTVELEESGWGTKVTLSADLAVAQPAEPEPAPEPEPEPEPDPSRSRSRSLKWRRSPCARPGTGAGSPAAPPSRRPSPTPSRRRYSSPSRSRSREPETVIDPVRATAVLEDTLDHLGAAHHRPFSREG